MKKIYITFLMISIIGSMSFAQDGAFRFKTIEISFASILQKDSLISLELYQNGILPKDYSFNYNFDSINNTHRLNYSISSIGGGNTKNLMGVPLIFAKLNFYSKEDHNKYFILIPIAFPICIKSEINKIEVLNIDLNLLLYQNESMISVTENFKYDIIKRDNLKLKKMIKIE